MIIALLLACDFDTVLQLFFDDSFHTLMERLKDKPFIHRVYFQYLSIVGEHERCQ